MKIEHLVQFAKLTSYPSLNKASEDLFISHQALSKMIASLEKEFGTTLIQRNEKGMLFTEDGLYLCGKVEEITSLLEQTELQIKESYIKKTQGNIVIYTDMITNAHIIPTILAYFENHDPSLSLDVHVLENLSSLISQYPDGYTTFFQRAALQPDTVGVFSFLGKKQEKPDSGVDFPCYLLQEREVLLVGKDSVDYPEQSLPEDMTVMINEREWGRNTLFIQELQPRQIYFVRSQRQCYLALENRNTYTVDLSDHFYGSSADYRQSAFQPPVYLYTYMICQENSSALLQTFCGLLKSLLHAE